MGNPSKTNRIGEVFTPSNAALLRVREILPPWNSQEKWRRATVCWRRLVDTDVSSASYRHPVNALQAVRSLSSGNEAPSSPKTWCQWNCDVATNLADLLSIETGTLRAAWIVAKPTRRSYSYDPEKTHELSSTLENRFLVSKER
jgi:hypothetical protein